MILQIIEESPPFLFLRLGIIRGFGERPGAGLVDDARDRQVDALKQ